MEMNLSRRENQLAQLENFVKDVDTEVTMILQSLQWDRKYLMQTKALVSCQYDSNHRVPPDKLKGHEQVCFLKSQGYSEKDRLLPSPVDPDASTLIKLSSDEINEIISNASRCQTLFNRGAGCSGIQPLTLDRLQATYTSDERRAIHDAVVNKVPSCHDLSDLTLLSAKDEESKDSKPKSKLEILAELRDMKRRRTKYRVAPKTRNYSDVLRDVINTQMELYTQTHQNVFLIKKEEETENDKTSKDKYSKEYQHKRDLKSEYQIDKGRCSDRYSDSRYSRHHEDYKSRKRRHGDEYQPSKYSKSERSKNRDNYERDRSLERDVDSTTFHTSVSYRGDKYERRKDDKEKHKRHHEDYNRRREHQVKQDRIISAKDIKKEKVDSTETAESNKSESFMSAEENIGINENRRSPTHSNLGSKGQNHNKYTNNDEKEYDKKITFKKEIEDDDFYNSEVNMSSEINNTSKKKHRKEHYDEHKYKRNRHDRQRYMSRDSEGNMVDKDKTNIERESGWSDDSEDGYSKRRDQRSQTKYSNYSTDNKPNEKTRHDKHEDIKTRDRHDKHGHDGRRRKDYRDRKHDDRAKDGNKKSSRSRQSPDSRRESDSYQRESDEPSYYKSHYKSYKGNTHQ